MWGVEVAVKAERSRFQFMCMFVTFLPFCTSVILSLHHK
uniref:Uncharacterized protein n=1 Tax=Trypanosoma brucei TaxID=5691 RepID=Q583C3_9TRYP|nr:hypothetical protein, unlikely [Trypanosoma brucei]